MTSITPTAATPTHPPPSPAKLKQSTTNTTAAITHPSTTLTPTTTNDATAATNTNWDFSSPQFDMKQWINQQLRTASTTTPPTPTATSTPALSSQLQEEDGAPQTSTTSTATSDLAAQSSHLSSILMKLQLLSADINSTMQIQSQELVQAMPKALRELQFIANESSSLRVNISDILKDMTTIEHAKPSATANAIAQSPHSTATALSSTPAAANSTPTGTATASTVASTIDFLHTIDVVKTRVTHCRTALEEEVHKQAAKEKERLQLAHSHVQSAV